MQSKSYIPRYQKMICKNNDGTTRQDLSSFSTWQKIHGYKQIVTHNEHEFFFPTTHLPPNPPEQSKNIVKIIYKQLKYNKKVIKIIPTLEHDKIQQKKITAKSENNKHGKKLFPTQNAHIQIFFQIRQDKSYAQTHHRNKNNDRTTCQDLTQQLLSLKPLNYL